MDTEDVPALHRIGVVLRVVRGEDEKDLWLQIGHRNSPGLIDFRILAQVQPFKMENRCWIQDAGPHERGTVTTAGLGSVCGLVAQIV